MAKAIVKEKVKRGRRNNWPKYIKVVMLSRRVPEACYEECAKKIESVLKKFKSTLDAED
jgi:hypothetical protein